MYISDNFCYCSFLLWLIFSLPVNVQLKWLNPLHWAYLRLIFFRVKQAQEFADAIQTFDYMFLLFNCLCLIKTCAYSHVTIIWMAATDYQIQVVLRSILILKAIDYVLLTKEKQLRMTGKMMTDFFQTLCSLYKKLGQLFFHTYWLT